jgi:hypothetical protein
MTKRLSKKRKWKDESGVSEVVGSILILLMTVMLFSGIIVWVWGLPTPGAVSRIDIETEFTPVDYELDDPPTWDVVFLNLTHRGGPKLLGSMTEMYLVVNNTAEVLKTSGISGEGAPYSLSGGNADWSIGETWQYMNYSIGYFDRVKISIADREANVILWEQNLWGYEGAHPPIFTDKWTDGNPNSDTRDLVEDNMTDITTGTPIPFAIHGKVGDLDNDLNSNSVYVTYRGGPLDGNSYKMVDNGSASLCDDTAGDSIFSVCNAAFWPGTDWLQWDGITLLLNASDIAGRMSTTRMKLSVHNFGDNLYQNDTTIEQGGGPGKPLEYAIFEEVEWVAHGQGYVITNTDVRGDEYYNKSVHYFNDTDLIQVKVLSNILENSFKSNVFRLYDAVTGKILQPPSYLTFFHAGVVASYHKYVLNWTANTTEDYDPNLGACYNVFIDIRDTDDDSFTTYSSFEVKKANGDRPLCPKVRFYADQAYTTETKSYDSWDYMYVEVEPAIATDNSVMIVTVEIQDFWGDSQIRSGPIIYTANPCGSDGIGPVSDVCIQSSKYGFTIDLLRANRDAWLLGNASYTLFLRMFSDANENWNSLSANVYINSPTSVMDIASGWKDTVTGTFDRYHGVFYENFGGYWEDSVYAFTAGASGQTDEIGAIGSVDFADMDSDGDKDIVAALEGGTENSKLTIYDNYNGRGSFSRTDIEVLGNNKYYLAVEAGDVNNDRLYDIVAATDEGRIYYYANDAVWDNTATIGTGIGDACSSSQSQQNGYTYGGKCIVIADLDNDNYGEVIVGTSTSLRVYKNQSGTQSAWDLKYNDNSYGDIVSVAVGDVGYHSSATPPRLDIVVGYEGGEVDVYLNEGGFLFERVPVDTANRNDIASVGVGNIDGTGYDDIVSGAGNKILLYKTSSHGEAGFWAHFANDDDTGGQYSPNQDGAIPGTIMMIRVGNIDGAVYDDVTIITDESGTSGRVYYYRNLDGPGRISDWQRFLVHDTVSWLGRAQRGLSIDIGDMNLGNPIA